MKSAIDMPVGRLCKRIDLHKIAGILRVDPDGPRCVDVGDPGCCPRDTGRWLSPMRRMLRLPFFGRAVRELAPVIRVVCTL